MGEGRSSLRRGLPGKFVVGGVETSGAGTCVARAPGSYLSGLFLAPQVSGGNGLALAPVPLTEKTLRSGRTVKRVGAGTDAAFPGACRQVVRQDGTTSAQAL